VKRRYCPESDKGDHHNARRWPSRDDIELFDDFAHYNQDLTLAFFVSVFGNSPFFNVLTIYKESWPRASQLMTTALGWPCWSEGSIPSGPENETSLEPKPHVTSGRFSRTFSNPSLEDMSENQVCLSTLLSPPSCAARPSVAVSCTVPLVQTLHADITAVIRAQLPAKLLDYFLRSNKSNINHSASWRYETSFLKDLQWCIRHHSSVEKSEGLNKFGLSAGPRFDSGQNPVNSNQFGFKPRDPEARVVNKSFQ